MVHQMRMLRSFLSMLCSFHGNPTPTKERSEDPYHGNPKRYAEGVVPYKAPTVPYFKSTSRTDIVIDWLMVGKPL